MMSIFTAQIVVNLIMGSCYQKESAKKESKLIVKIVDAKEN